MTTTSSGQAHTEAPRSADHRLTVDEPAAVIARAINLGIGQPTRIADHLPADSGMVLHTYLTPDGTVAAKLLVQALGRSSKVAVAKYAWSGRERPGLLRVREDALVLQAMRWPDEIRDPAEHVPPPVEVDEGAIEDALALVGTMSREDLEDEEFRNTYTDALAKVIEAEREQQALSEAPEAQEEPGKVLDLMAALQESVNKARSSRDETGDADVHDLSRAKNSPAKKTAKKTPAKKTAAKTASRSTTAKRTAKKTAARKPRSA